MPIGHRTLEGKTFYFPVSGDGVQSFRDPFLSPYPLDPTGPRAPPSADHDGPTDGYAPLGACDHRLKPVGCEARDEHKSPLEPSSAPRAFEQCAFTCVLQDDGFPARAPLAPPARGQRDGAASKTCILR